MKNEFKVLDHEVHIYIKTKEGRKVVRVSKEDFSLVSSIKGSWVGERNNRNGKYYVRTHWEKNGKRGTILLHRFILGEENVQGLHVDHIDHDSLNNTRENLVATTMRRNITRSQDFIQVVKGEDAWEVKQDEVLLYSHEDRKTAQIVGLFYEMTIFPFLRRFKSFELLFKRHGLDYMYVESNMKEVA